MTEANEELDALLQDQDNDTDLIRNLRKALKAQRKTVKDATEQAQAATQASLIAQAGLSLNETQLEALKWKMGSDTDLSVDKVKQLAQDFGFQTQSPQPAPPPNPTNAPPPPDPNQPPGQPVNPNTPPAQPPNQPAPPAQPSVPQAEISALQLMEQAARENSQRGDQEFQDKLRNATSAKEVSDLIKSQGPKHRLIHQDDMQ